MAETSDTQTRYRIINRVNWLCTLVDTLLTILKLGVGFAIRSPGLIADGFHSLSDLATDILALLLGNVASQGPDQDHPYGHARYETVGTAVLGTVLILVAGGIAIESIQALLSGHFPVPHWTAVIAVLISIASKEALFQYTHRKAKETNSALLEANAWHSRSDSLSSIVVLVGLIAGFAGWPWVEYIAAIGVALLIAKMGAELAWNALQDLIDRGASEEQTNAYMNTLNDIQDIIDVHNMRSRLMANDVFLDAHIQLAPRISVSEAHQINDYAVSQLKKTHSEVKDVTLHIDFEADQHQQKTQLMPKRHELRQQLDTASIPAPERMDLHYHQDQVFVCLIYHSQNQAQLASERTADLIETVEWIGGVQVLLEISNTTPLDNNQKKAGH
ncbi:cation diffusion facilitator family transporter [Reinekea blandensis]|uniref:Predicted Co/Zn/Cd cation transporter n=1 Tax=Reinekea blandensis MED297 TaxID=314283 RepID=A4BEK1_9GAMM|nr:cation diffusion facilitator family transporter [Reinekea blandensis]EAR09428.1 predicted Co/Zn/Cd cation transporter [Reinekea sp. MED297] [Reinekea blandensis MED297]